MSRLYLISRLTLTYICILPESLHAQASFKVGDPFLDKGFVDSAIQSSQHIMYSPIATCILFLSILGVFIGIGLHHGRTIAVSSFISTVILFGRYFSETIFSSFQVFQLSFIGPVFLLVIFGKVVSTYLKHKSSEHEDLEEKKSRQRYHQVRSKNILREDDHAKGEARNVILNPLTGSSKSSINKNSTPSISISASAATKLTRPF